MPTLSSPLSTPVRRRSRISLIVLFVVGTVVLAYAVWALGVYEGGWRGTKTLVTSRIMPLPSALVGWQPLSLRSYLWHQETIAHYTAYLSKNSPGVFGAGQTPDSRQVALTKIIRDRATERLAARHNLTVSSTDLDQAFNAQLLQGGDRAETEQAIKDLYNWTPEQFKHHVLRVAVIREKLREKLSFDDTLNTSQRQQVERVYALVKDNPLGFADLAKQYSEDAYGASGGDLGFFPRGEQAQEIDDAAFTLEPGEVSEIIHTKFGWHILLVEGKKELDGQEQVRARQIFIAAPSVDEYITTQLNTWGVRILLPEFSWNDKNGQVTVE